VDGDFFQVQCLIFSKLDHMLENEIATPLCTVSGPGTYAIVHFMGLDVFGEPDNNMKLYGHMQKFFTNMRTASLYVVGSNILLIYIDTLEIKKTLCLFLR